MHAAALALCTAVGGFAAAPAKAEANPMLADMMPVGFNFCPRGWALADGQILPINQNQSLFSLLGTTYGGDGRTSFALPDLRGRYPIGVGNVAGLGNYTWGQKGGAEFTTMTVSTMPAHSHSVNATNAAANKLGPGGDLLATTTTENSGVIDIYHDGPPNRTMRSNMLTNTGGGQAFNILEPYTVINWCIALQGLFPSRN